MPSIKYTDSEASWQPSPIVREGDIEESFIATCLSSLDALITAETQKLKAFKPHKKGPMQQLFPSPQP